MCFGMFAFKASCRCCLRVLRATLGTKAPAMFLTFPSIAFGLVRALPLGLVRALPLGLVRALPLGLVRTLLGLVRTLLGLVRTLLGLVRTLHLTRARAGGIEQPTAVG
jgi:hypothetical protein